jgi:hypothetical protein
VSQSQRNTFGLVALAMFLLLLNFAFSGVVASWFQVGGSFLGRWLVPGIALGIILFAIKIWFGAMPSWSSYLITGFVSLMLIEPLSNWLTPTSAYTATGTNWLMNPVTGTVFEAEPQTGCRLRIDCFDPDHSDGRGGTDLVTFNETIVDLLQTSNQQQPALIFPVVDENGCTGRYALQVNCKRVTLHASEGESIDWVVDKSIDSRSRCIQFNPSTRLQTSLLRNESDEPVGTTFTFTGNGQMTYTIFEVPVGQTGPGGARCGS